MDVAISIALFSVLGIAVGAYLVRLATAGPARHARVDAEGKSALVAKGAMEMLYWSVQPVVAACARTGVTANAITWTSLVLGLGAAGAIGAGHFGIGAGLAALSALGDALDGLVARHTHTASDEGEVLDAAVDRYVELAILGGLAFHFRGEVAPLLLALAALAGSVMVSYSTAKAEALHVTPPRGSMRRAERAVLVTAGAALTPLTAWLDGAFWRELPVLLALGLVAILGNASAVTRLASIRASVRSRAASPAHTPESTSTATGDVVVERTETARP